MWWGLLVALAGATCAGLGAIFQALAARAVPSRADGLRPSLIIDLIRQWRFLVGIGLDLLSFLASFAALRVLPIFVVQACSAGALAVTAVTAWWWLGCPLARRERIGVLAVCLGLFGLGASAAQQGSEHGDLAMHVGILVAVGVLALLGVGAARLTGKLGAASLGILAGLCFGVVNIASRVLPASMAPLALISDPALYAMPVAGVCAMLFYSTALQRESVIAAASGALVGQTVLPTVVGLVLLGDSTRPGFDAVAVVGFAIALAGALVLARFGDLTEQVEPTPVAA